MPKKTQRIKHARRLVGEIYPWGGQYRYNYWPEGVDRPGRESNPCDYHSALSSRAQTLIAIANDSEEQVDYCGGSWTDYVV